MAAVAGSRRRDENLATSSQTTAGDGCTKAWLVVARRTGTIRWLRRPARRGQRRRGWPAAAVVGAAGDERRVP